MERGAGFLRRRFNRFQDICWEPKPVRSHLPIWIGGRREAAMRRAARFGDGWMPYMYSPAQMADSAHFVREEADRLGRDPSSIRMGIAVYVTVHHDSAMARRVAAETISSMYNQDLQHAVDRYLIVGNPDQCRRRLREYYDAGARVAFLTLGCPNRDADEMLDLLVREVLPEVRKPSGLT